MIFYTSVSMCWLASCPRWMGRLTYVTSGSFGQKWEAELPSPGAVDIWVKGEKRIQTESRKGGWRKPRNAQIFFTFAKAWSWWAMWEEHPQERTERKQKADVYRTATWLDEIQAKAIFEEDSFKLSKLSVIPSLHAPDTHSIHNSLLIHIKILQGMWVSE